MIKNIPFLTLLIFCLPLGMGKRPCYVTTTILLGSFLVLSVNKLRAFTLIVISFIILASFIALLQKNQIEPNFYQFFRVGIPLILSLGLIDYFSNDSSQNRIEFSQGKVEKICEFWSFSVALWCLAEKLGFRISNTSFASGEFERMYTFPIFVPMFFLYIFSRKGKILAALAALIPIIFTGGKSPISCGLMFFALGVYHSNIPGRSLKKYIFPAVIVASSIALGIDFVINRFYELSESGGVDMTRQMEIDWALDSWKSNYFSILFGNGLALPITPGVPSPDPTWFENSQFDVENEFVNLLAKFGLIGSSMILYFIYIFSAKSISEKFVIGCLTPWWLAAGVVTSIDGVFIGLCLGIIKHLFPIKNTNGIRK